MLKTGAGGFEDMIVADNGSWTHLTTQPVRAQHPTNNERIIAGARESRALGLAARGVTMGGDTLIFLSLKVTSLGSQSAPMPAGKCENFARASSQGVVK